MNFVLGFLLMMSGGKEEEAFWFFVSLAKRPEFGLLGFYNKDFTLVWYFIFLFKERLEKYAPGIAEHFDGQGIHDCFWVYK